MPPIRSWLPAPPTVRATPGVVHVWRADLGAMANDGLSDLLCAEERERAVRILGERNRALWLRSRGVLRALLGRYLDRDPHELRFELAQHGKPALREGTGSALGLRFNLSHSGELMLVAVTAGREVGVDIECVRRDHARSPIDEPAIAARMLGLEQARRLEGLDPETRKAEFLRAWTMREATVKCLGTGLVSAASPSEDDTSTEVWTAELDGGPRAIAAVVVQGSEACELRCWDSAPTLTPR